MRRGTVLTGVIALVAGFLLGTQLPLRAAPPVNYADKIISSSPPSSATAAPANSASPSIEADSALSAPRSLDNFALLNSACAVTCALQNQDYYALASFVHPQQGVTFTPYSTVNLEQDLTFTPAQIRALPEDQTVYTWGFPHEKGDPIQLTMTEYFAAYVFDADYTQAPHLGIDQIIMNGNALENLAEAYPGCRFVDFCFPTLNSVNQGQDWCSLKLVFRSYQDTWKLVGIVHGQWTI